MVKGDEKMSDFGQKLYRVKSQDELLAHKDLAAGLDVGRKAISDYIEKQAHDQIVGEIKTKAIDHGPMDLTLGRLTEAMDQIKRYDHIYIMESAHIPDDAIGVLWVRPEDARRMKK